MTLSEFVKNKRKEYNLTQVGLARETGVGLRFVRDLEQGKSTLRMDKVNQVLALFGSSLGPGFSGLDPLDKQIKAMADNYLEKRYDEVFGAAAKKPSVKRGVSVETLMKRNRSYREYDTSYVVKEAQLEAIVRVNRYLPSGRNAQSLRFRLLTKETGSDKLQGLYHLGRALPELHLPRKGAEPEAFIVICSTVPSWKNLYIDLGISCQGMLLKATEMGLQGVIICNFKPEEVKAALGLPLDPVCIIAVGKGLEKIEITEIGAGEDYNYYRKDGVHYVPKIKLKDLII